MIDVGVGHNGDRESNLATNKYITFADDLFLAALLVISHVTMACALPFSPGFVQL